MNRKEISIEQFNKLKDCKVFNRYSNKWNDSKLVRTGKTRSTVACTDGVNVFQSLFKNSLIKLPNNN